ncbi:MAG: geranylgeranylglycerol-phosphate geranylgeranyltransferase [Flavobacterium sp.]|nr:geranylgeranylglycerol-phosphate geranylgeranyltransferase [Flavobacterium sp.]
MTFLNLIRYRNLLLLAFMQLIFRFGYLEIVKIPLSMWHWQYFLLILCTTLIAAGGYVINDIFDQETDSINKPEKVCIGTKISEELAYKIYAGLTIAGVGIGFILSNSIQHPNFAGLYVLIAILLYLYSSTLKKIAVFGNIVVALVLGFSVIIIGIFDIYPNTFPINQQLMSLHFSILFGYAKFAFIINFIREIVKDIEDIKGDKLDKLSTLPIVIGTKNTTKIVSVLILIPILFLLYYCDIYLMSSKLIYTTLYILFLVVAPLQYCAIKIWNATEKKDFQHISTILKWILFFGIISITVLTFNIKYNG